MEHPHQASVSHPPASASTSSKPDLVSELEEVMEKSFELMDKNEGRKSSEEVRSGMEEMMGKFCDLARALDSTLLKKRFVLSRTHPEFIVKEEVNEVKQEIARKEALIQRYHEKISHWMTVLNGIGSNMAASPASAQPLPIPQSPLRPGEASPGINPPQMTHPPAFLNARPRFMSPTQPIMRP